MQKTPFPSNIFVSNKAKPMFRSLTYHRKLLALSISQLNELYLELENMIKVNSDILIHELALRDELEFHKELKNKFISLLLEIQNKRKQITMEKKLGNKCINEPKYLDTVVPYNDARGPPNIQTIQILIKILKAINIDSPAVPSLLADFIFKMNRRNSAINCDH